LGVLIVPLSRRQALALLSTAVLPAWRNGKPLTLAQLQANYVARQFGLFIHFSMATFTNTENSPPSSSPTLFSPTGGPSTFVPQWISTAQAAKARYLALISKHSDGFCLWPTATTTYNLSAASPWYANNGSPDIVSVFATQCRAAGIAPVLYFSIPDGTFANTGGNTAQFKAYIEAQLTELLSNYGLITAIWIDWAGNTPPSPFVSQAELTNFIQGLQSQCLVIQNDHSMTLTTSNIVEYEVPVTGTISNGNVTVAEACEPIQTDNKWFWHAASNTYRTSSTIITNIQHCNANDGTYLLDTPPDNTGIIPSAMVTILTSVGLR
jgi:alpha-L-fucosidase